MMEEQKEVRAIFFLHIGKKWKSWRYVFQTIVERIGAELLKYKDI